MEITKDTIIGDLLKEDFSIAYALMDVGMHCVNCPASYGETLEEACIVHGLDVDDVIVSVENYLRDKE